MATKTIGLSRAYTYEGKTYGPGQADMPVEAAESIGAKEAEYQKYLSQGGEPNAPITPGGGGEALHDPRLRKPKPEATAPEVSEPVKTAPAVAPAASAVSAKK